jgi:hypothetical protein
MALRVGMFASCLTVALGAAAQPAKQTSSAYAGGCGIDAGSDADAVSRFNDACAAQLLGAIHGSGLIPRGFPSDYVGETVIAFLVRHRLEIDFSRFVIAALRSLDWAKRAGDGTPEGLDGLADMLDHPKSGPRMAKLRRIAVKVRACRDKPSPGVCAAYVPAHQAARQAVSASAGPTVGPNRIVRAAFRVRDHRSFRRSIVSQ